MSQLVFNAHRHCTDLLDSTPTTLLDTTYRILGRYASGLVDAGTRGLHLRGRRQTRRVRHGSDVQNMAFSRPRQDMARPNFWRTYDPLVLSPAVERVQASGSAYA